MRRNFKFNFTLVITCRVLPTASPVCARLARPGSQVHWGKIDLGAVSPASSASFIVLTKNFTNQQPFWSCYCHSLA